MDAAGLIDWRFGTVERRIFRHAEIYERELERIFTRFWRLVVRESQIKQPGAFVTT